MKRYIKELICLALQLIMFYLFPLFAGPTDAMGMVVIILVTTWLFAMIVGMLSKNKIKYLYPIIVAILFIPSVFIHYNSSALIHSIWYLVDAFAGLLWGMLVCHLSRLLNKKATSKTINNA